MDQPKSSIFVTLKSYYDFLFGNSVYNENADNKVDVDNESTEKNDPLDDILENYINNEEFRKMFDSVDHFRQYIRDHRLYDNIEKAIVYNFNMWNNRLDIKYMLRYYVNVIEWIPTDCDYSAYNTTTINRKTFTRLLAAAYDQETNQIHPMITSNFVTKYVTLSELHLLNPLLTHLVGSDIRNKIIKVLTILLIQ